jgi:predicted phage-related endonuclease
MNELVEVIDNKISVSKETIKKIKKFEQLKIEMDIFEKEIKEELKEKMEQLGIEQSICINGMKVTYRKASSRISIDSKKLKEEQPKVYEKYSNTTVVASSISLGFDL